MVDSDFDIDEDDEVISDNEGEQEKEKKRRSGVITKAYKVGTVQLNTLTAEFEMF